MAVFADGFADVRLGVGRVNMDVCEFNRRLSAIYEDRNAGMGEVMDLLTDGVRACLERLDRMESPPGVRREGTEPRGVRPDARHNLRIPP